MNDKKTNREVLDKMQLTIEIVEQELAILNNSISDAVQGLKMEVCVNCGIMYGVPEDFIQKRRRDERSFYCPNGHSQWYSNENSEKKLKKQIRELHADYDVCKADMKAQVATLMEENKRLDRSREYYRGKSAQER